MRAPHRSTRTGLLVAAIALAAPTIGSAPSSAQADEIRSRPGTIVIETADPSIDPADPALVEYAEDLFRSLPTDNSAPDPLPFDAGRSASLNGGISVDYNSSYPSPASVKSVVNAAVAQWDSVLATNGGPIEIEFYWTCMDLGLLGSAGPSGFYQSGSLPTNDWYPAALANTLLGYDVTDATEGETVPEVRVVLNSALASGNNCGQPGGLWYVGTSGNPTGGQVDLYSVVLHEIGHGLGFLGSGTAPTDAQGNVTGQPALTTPGFAFDRFVTYGGGLLLDQADPDSLLTSQNLGFRVGGDLNYSIYAPSSWQEGSSLSHFDESTYQSGAGALMTPVLNHSEVERSIDTPTIGVLHQIGWPIAIGATPPSNVSVAISGSTVTTSWSHNLASPGIPPTGYRIQLYQNNTLVGSSNVAGTVGTTSVSGFVSGQSHHLIITPVGPEGNGTPVSVGPGSPSTVGVTGSGTTRTISWTSPIGGSAPISSFDVQMSLDGGGWSTIAHTSATSTSHGPIPDQSIAQFRVRSNTVFGTSAWSCSTMVGISSSVVRPFPLDGQVGRLYTAYFLRSPDASGFDHWLRQRASGLSIEAISAAFADSAEFQNRYGSLTNSQFVNLVYSNVLGRQPDAAGLSYWMAALNRGTSRGAVMASFADSPEYVTQTASAAPTSSQEGQVYRLYLAFFLRGPDQAGSDFWVNRLATGIGLPDIAEAFVASTEFENTYGSLNDSEFIDLVYSNVLGRQPDSAGRSFWLGRMATGATRGEVMVGFSESLEFILVTGSIP